MKWIFLISIFFLNFGQINSAHASGSDQCFMGGVVVPMVNGHCDIQGLKPCTRPNSFLCEGIYGKTCILYNSTDDIPKNCYDHSREYVPSAQEFKAIAKEMTPAYQDTCLDNLSSNTANGCLYFTKRVNELNKVYKTRWFNADDGAEERMVTANTMRTAGRDDQRKKSKKQIVKDPYGDNTKLQAELCPNEFDPVKKVALQVPHFDLDADSTCVYERNKKLLAEVADNGCSGKSPQPDNKLVKTMFHPGQSATCSYGNDCFDAIIENVAISDGVIEMTLLKPKINVVPPTLVRETIHLKKVSNGYQLVDDPYGHSYVYKIDNMPRLDILTKYQSAAPRKSIDDPRPVDGPLKVINDVRVMFADNCKLSKALTEQHLYQTTSSPAPTAQPGSTGK
jgi:hypothetical protein